MLIVFFIKQVKALWKIEIKILIKINFIELQIYHIKKEKEKAIDYRYINRDGKCITI